MATVSASSPTEGKYALDHVGWLVGHEKDVDAVQHDAEDDQGDGEEEPAHGALHGPVVEEREGRDHADHELDQERDRPCGVTDEIEIAPAVDEVAQLDHAVDSDEPDHETGEGRQELHLGVSAEADAGVDRLQDHHREAHHDGRQEEEKREDGRVPQRTHLRGGDEHEGAQGGLVHEGQHHSRHDEYGKGDPDPGLERRDRTLRPSAAGPRPSRPRPCGPGAPRGWPGSSPPRARSGRR